MAELSDLLKKALKPPTPVDKSPRMPTDAEMYEVPKDLIKPIAQKCRSDDYYIIDCARCLLQQVENNKNGYVRMRALYLMDYFFTHSKLFRAIVAKDLKLILKCTRLIPGDVQGPDIAVGDWDTIQAKVKVLIEIWDIGFGHIIPEIRTTRRYLTESLRLEMPNLMERAIAEEEANERARKEHDTKLLRRCLVFVHVKESVDVDTRDHDTRHSEMASKCNDISDVISEATRLLELLFPSASSYAEDTTEAMDDPTNDSAADDDVEWEVHDDTMIRIDALLQAQSAPASSAQYPQDDGNSSLIDYVDNNAYSNVDPPAIKQRRLNEIIPQPAAAATMFGHCACVGNTHTTLVRIYMYDILLQLNVDFLCCRLWICQYLQRQLPQRKMRSLFSISGPFIINFETTIQYG
jgi:hypothetical protein